MNVTRTTALRALAHPLRLDLIEVLSTIGPATAATCAKHLGTTQANCSFHLRQLAKYGYVERDAGGGDRRERPWRLVDNQQTWSSVDDGAAAVELERVFVEREASRILQWIESSGEEDESWRRAAILGGFTLPVTAHELSTLGEQLMNLLQPYIDRLKDGASSPADARFVRILLSTTPLASPHPLQEQPTKSTEE